MDCYIVVHSPDGISIATPRETRRFSNVVELSQTTAKLLHDLERVADDYASSADKLSRIYKAAKDAIDNETDPTAALKLILSSI